MKIARRCAFAVPTLRRGSRRYHWIGSSRLESRVGKVASETACDVQRRPFRNDVGASAPAVKPPCPGSMTTVENDTATEMPHVSSQAASPRKTKASLNRDIPRDRLGELLDLRSFDDGSKHAWKNVRHKALSRPSQARREPRAWSSEALAAAVQKRGWQASPHNMVSGGWDLQLIPDHRSPV
jgi:hypothetical protein